MAQELSKLKKVLKTRSLAQVAVDLGYRSASTVFHWITNGEIPRSAIERVRRYLEKRSYDDVH